MCTSFCILQIYCDSRYAAAVNYFLARIMDFISALKVQTSNLIVNLLPLFKLPYMHGSPAITENHYHTRSFLAHKILDRRSVFHQPKTFPAFPTHSMNPSTTTFTRPCLFWRSPGPALPLGASLPIVGSTLSLADKLTNKANGTSHTHIPK
jgi:hypothetical protein